MFFVAFFQNVKVDGTVSSAGQTPDVNVYSTGAGSGGSVWLLTEHLRGHGTIRANGGTGDDYGSHGM